MSASHRDKSATVPRLDPPETVRGIAKRLEDAGFETWCVGGAVRDALLGHPHLDWDLATRATPTEVRKLFKRTVPVGVEFGTIRSEEHTSELQSQSNLVCRLLLEKKKKTTHSPHT